MERPRIKHIVVIVLASVFLLSLLHACLRKSKSLDSNYEKATPEEGLKEDAVIADIPGPDGPLEIRYEGSLKDPLMNQFKLYLANLPSAPPTPPEPQPLPRLNIKGLIWNTDMPQAIINDKVVRLGDIVAEARVIKIIKEGITVEYQGRTVFVPKT